MMPDYPPCGRGQGHVTYFYILGPGHILGANEASHFKFGLYIERKEYWHYACKSSAVQGCIQSHVSSLNFGK